MDPDEEVSSLVLSDFKPNTQHTLLTRMAKHTLKWKKSDGVLVVGMGSDSSDGNPGDLGGDTASDGDNIGCELKVLGGCGGEDGVG